MNWKIEHTEYLSRHKYFTARRDRCRRPDGVLVDPYFVVELPTSACALAITADEHVVLIKQFRHPIGETIFEIPGGFIDEDEAFEQGMKRELLEETGYAFTHIEHLGKIAANPGVLNNYTELFLATGGKKISDQMLDQNEDITVVLVSLDELIDMLLQNNIKQSLHATCIFYALQKMGKLQLG